MSEFVMEGRDRAASAESEFVLGFTEALFFTNCGHVDSAEWFTTDPDERTTDGQLPADVGYTDLHPDSVAAIRTFCEAWQAENSELLEMACGMMTGYCETQAGRDLWFTMNGHGVGFWDREELRRDMARRPDGTLTDTGEDEGLPFLASLGDLLSDRAGRREVCPFYGDHVTHGNAPFVHVDL